MTYIFEFTVTGTGTVNIYRNGILQTPLQGSRASKVVYFEYGDTFRQECLPAEDFIGASNNIDSSIETDPNYTATILVESFYIYVTFKFKQTAPLCSSLSVDTWKPKITNPASGAFLDVTVRSKEPNKDFDIGYADGITLERHVVLSGRTDSSGCYTGQIPAQIDGTYSLTVCFLFFGLPCPITNPINPIAITWGVKPLDWGTMGLIAAGIIGGAYVIGQVIGSRRQ